MTEKIFPIIMAGGQGTRFWPESTSKKPKQYLNLVGNNSLLQDTLDRFSNIAPANQRYIVTVKAQKELVQKQSSSMIGSENIIFEPAGRNTAPCILLSLAFLKRQGAKDDDIVAIVPSDHVILNTNGFEKTIKKAVDLANKNNSIVTIGISPNFPHTGFGYIQKGDVISGESFQVKGFKEKPSFELAKEYISSGEYFWNAGMFVSKFSTLLKEFESCSPSTFKHYYKLLEVIDNEELLEKAYGEIPSDSIDYAVMEKSKNVQVTAAQFDWNDLGSWDALEEVLEKKEENTLIGEKHLFIKNSRGNIVYAPDKLVSLINIENLIVIDNKDSLTILPKSDSQEVKNIVAHLKENSWGQEFL